VHRGNGSGVEVAELLERANGFRGSAHSFLNAERLVEWLVGSGFAEPAGEGRVLPTELAYEVVELLSDYELAPVARR
jgi:hypothetical protein